MAQPKQKKPWSVFIAIVLGVLFGLASQQGSPLFTYAYPLYSLLGKMFINSLTLVVVPVVASSIITGMARVGSDSAFGRLGIKMFVFYFGTSLIAIFIGLVLANLLQPGKAIEPETLSALALPSSPHLTVDKVPHFSDLFLQFIPSNIIESLGKGQMLGIIFFSLLFGYSISKIGTKNGTLLIGFWEGIFQTMIRFTQLIMKVLPFGVFCLVAQVFAEEGIRSLASLGLFTLVVLLGLALFMFCCLPLLLKWVGGVSPSRHFKAMGPALITAFSTSSSSATLPVTIDCVEKRAGVSNKICSLVVPLGTSVNMSGSALYACVATLFVSQVYGMPLSLSSQLAIVFLSLVTSIGVAGIPSASLIAIIAILKAVGLPTEGIGFFIAVDRILDMCRSATNVFSDSCCAVLVARTEGEKGVLSRDPDRAKS